LVEALVALAIAALLAVVLTRFVSGSRANAQKVREEVALELASNDLLEHLATGKSLPRRIDGRSGRLAWHINIESIPFSANAEVVSEKKPAGASNGQPATSSPLASGGLSNGGQSNSAVPSPMASALLPLADLMASAAQANPPAKESHVVWSPYRVIAVVKAPSGRSYAVDTIRIVPQQPESPQSAQGQR
jgi:type II secretory pathway pseudopilin PulG